MISFFICFYRFAKHFSHWHSVIAATDYCFKASNAKHVAIGFTSAAQTKYLPGVSKPVMMFSMKTGENKRNSMYYVHMTGLVYYLL